MVFSDWNLIDYKQAWEKQQAIFDKVLEAKKMSLQEDFQEIIFCEHPHVFTLGKNGKGANMLISEAFLQQIGAQFYKIDRGGDITYHGPGQIVGYPILDLEKIHVSLKSYIHILEEIIIRTLSDFGISAERLEGATGVWIDAHKSTARKICAIGVKASRYITMHGFALNVNTDLKYYSYINPCGFVDKGVTSIEKELNRKVDINEVQEVLKKHFRILFEERGVFIN